MSLEFIVLNNELTIDALKWIESVKEDLEYYLERDKMKSIPMSYVRARFKRCLDELPVTLINSRTMFRVDMP